MKFHHLFALLAFLPPLVCAEVNPKNGNFVITYQEMVQANSGRELNLRRTYNSLSHRHLGWFGWGWSTPWETRLHAMPDGTVVVLESGSGLMHFYDPVSSPVRHAQGLDAIVSVATARNKLTPQQAKALRAELEGDEELRVHTAMKLGVSAETTPGAQWKSRRCGGLERVSVGWFRMSCDDDSKDQFSPAGALLRRQEGDGQVQLVWDGNRLKSVIDSSGLRLDYDWNAQGHIAAVTGSSGMQVRYTYSPGGDMVRSEGPSINGGQLDFSYDNAHRMTRVTYMDTTAREMAYNADGQVAETTERNGTRTTYEYGGSGSSYWTRVRTFAYGGDQSIEREHKFDIAPSKTGIHAVARVIVKEGDKETTLDHVGRIVRVASAGKVVEEREYDDANGRLQRVRNEIGDYSYAYDEQGQLTRVERGTVAFVEFDYEDGGRIRQLREVDRSADTDNTVELRYGSSGNRPTSIVISGLSLIEPIYGNDGRITEMRTDNDPEEAETRLRGIIDRVRAMVQPSGGHAPL